MLGHMLLTAEEARVLGSLVEKELTTPDQYPLTIKSLLAACNQASNRDPVVNYDEETVMAALDSLKAQRLIRFVLPSHGRTAVRYRHVLNEALGLDQRQCALLAVLVLRGPQTIGELRARTERMADFDGLDEIDHELRFLSAVAEPLATSLGRRPGQKEERWVTPLVAPAPTPATVPTVPTAPAVPAAPLATQNADPLEPVGYGRDGSPDDVRSDSHDPLVDLRSEIAALRAEVDGLRRDLNALRISLGE
jgi:uncharacterized protein YceH (UPF0502 family)